MRIAQAFLRIEPLIIAVIVCAYWFTDPARTLTLLLLIPVLIARWAVYRRFFTFLPLIGLALAFLALSALSQLVAPFQLAQTPIAVRALGWTSAPIGAGWLMISSLVMGLALLVYFVERARTGGNIDVILLASALLGIVVAVAPLVATQWNEKSALFSPITRLLPNVTTFPGADQGFNANEVAGVMAWLTPLMAGLALLRKPLRFVAALAFWLLLLVMFLGQSRLAIAGVVVGLAGVIWLLIPTGRKRYLALLALAAFAALEVAIAANVFVTPAHAQTMQVRDSWATGGRLEIWRSALLIIHDYPLTGAGANMFRAGEVRRLYPAPAFGPGFLPHTHNELLQAGTDLGIPGMVVFIAWYVALGMMLLRTWRRGDHSARVVAVAAGAGLVAHGVFAAADAILVWDRFGFVFWWMIGVVAAQYVLTCYGPQAQVTPGTDSTRRAKARLPP